MLTREYLYGANSIRESLKANNRIKSIYVAGGKNEKLGDILALARARAIPVEEKDRGSLNDLVRNDAHQGIIAEAEPYKYCLVEEILAAAKSQGEKPLVVLLDGIEDPHNMGAIIRVAECLGVHGVILTKHNACDIIPSVVKSSAGATEHLRISKVTNLVKTIQELKDQGLWVIGTDASARASCSAVKFADSLAIVVGSEGKGMRHLVKENCDLIVNIPMTGKVNSLNASVACGIMLYEVYRQRLDAGNR